jgi:hypothetical protein
VGRSALEADLRATFENYALEFLQNDVESLSIHGDIAVEQILFSVKALPKKVGRHSWSKAERCSFWSAMTRVQQVGLLCGKSSSLVQKANRPNCFLLSVELSRAAGPHEVKQSFMNCRQTGAAARYPSEGTILDHRVTSTLWSSGFSSNA